jgi:hypothetical protein
MGNENADAQNNQKRNDSSKHRRVLRNQSIKRPTALHSQRDLVERVKLAIAWGFRATSCRRRRRHSGMTEPTAQHPAPAAAKQCRRSDSWRRNEKCSLVARRRRSTSKSGPDWPQRYGHRSRNTVKQVVRLYPSSKIENVIALDPASRAPTLRAYRAYNLPPNFNARCQFYMRFEITRCYIIPLFKSGVIA